LLERKNSNDIFGNLNMELKNYSKLEFWIKVIHLFLPLILILQTSAGFFPARPLCGFI
jgi:hypothetical protein